jgi:hypothetical protein
MKERGSSSPRRGTASKPAEEFSQGSYAKRTHVSRAPLSVRISQPLYDTIARSAAEAGRSISREVQSRLEDAYAGEIRYGGPRLATVLQRLVAAAASLKARYQTEPLDNPLAYKALRRSWIDVIDSEAPWREPLLIGSALKILWREPGRQPRPAHVSVNVVLAPEDRAGDDALTATIESTTAAEQITLTIKDLPVIRPEARP